MKIIIDTDIGDDIDDAFALQLALNTPELEILGVTTAFRNAYKRGKIVAALLAANKRRDIPVYAGEDEALSGGICKLTYETEPMKDSDGSVNVPQYREEFSSYEVKRGGVEFLLRAASENPGEVTLVCLAPLTNVAAAYLKDGETFSKLKKIVMMGGQVNGDYAEWNFRCDAKAAKIVFESGMPIKMIGINVTKYCKLTEREISFVNASESGSGKLLSQMLKKWLADNDYEKSPIMHDGLAVAELTENFCVYETRSATVCEKGENAGKLAPGKYPAEMATEVKNEEFIDFLMSRLRRTI